MKVLWLVTALILVASAAAAQESPCDAKIRAANGVIEELQQQVRVMSVRAAQHYGRVQVLLAKLDAANVKVVQLTEED